MIPMWKEEGGDTEKGGKMGRAWRNRELLEETETNVIFGTC
jgi:hypothetical protein